MIAQTKGKATFAFAASKTPFVTSNMPTLAKKATLFLQNKVKTLTIAEKIIVKAHIEIIAEVADETAKTTLSEMTIEVQQNPAFSFGFL